jgi:hypothetical protein
MALLDHLSDDDLRSLCLDTIRGLPKGLKPQLTDYLSAVGRLAFERGLPQGPLDAPGIRQKRLDNEDDSRSADMLMDFLVDGILRPGTGNIQGSTTGNSWPFFHLTARGKAILASPRPTPYDPSGFLGEIRAISGMDDVVVSYVEESIEALRHHLLKSCVITLGVASERAFSSFLESLVAAINDQAKSDVAEKLLVGVPIQRAFDSFEKKYKGPMIVALKADDVGRSLAHNIDTYLGSMLINMKEYRNDAGHALKVATSRRVAEAHLSMFPDYAAKVFGLIKWLKTNKLAIP